MAHPNTGNDTPGHLSPVRSRPRNPTNSGDLPIDPAGALDHRRLAALHALATQVYLLGRVDDAIRHSECAQRLMGDRQYEQIPFGYGADHGSPYIAVGQPERWVEACRMQMEHDGNDNHGHTAASLAMALSLAGAVHEAAAVQQGIVEKAEATQNPHSLSHALLAEGLVYRYSDPIAALAALRRSLQVARDSGNRFYESHIAVTLAQLEVRQGITQSAFDHLALAIGNYQDSGNIATSQSPLAILAALLYQLGRYEPAATIAGFAVTELTRMAFPEVTETITHLRKELGNGYQVFARRGQSMSNAAMSRYALDQIDIARSRLSPGESP